MIDSTYDGILWLQHKHKYSELCMFACVCYLPPNGSSRQVDVHDFFDSLLAGIYKFQNDVLIFICGDFNSRCGLNDDFIVGIDDVPGRNVIDFTSNAYGNILIELFL